MMKTTSSSRSIFLLFLLCIVITLFNTVYMQSNTVMFLSIPQYLLVFFFLFRGKYRTAFLLHAVFIAACVSMGTVIEDGQNPFLYIKCTLYGPITFNLLILSILWLLVVGRPILLDKGSLLLKTRKIILYLLISGTVIGLVGLLFLKYYDWKFIVSRVLFVGEIYLFIDIFVHLYTVSFSKQFETAAICMMAAAPVASVVSFSLFNVHAVYGLQDTAYVNPIMGLTPCLIIALLHLEKRELRIVSLIGLGFYAVQLMILSRGHNFLELFVVVILLVYLLYFKRNPSSRIKSFKQSKSFKFLLPVFLLVFIPFAIGALTSASDVSLRKFEQFTSLFSIISLSDEGLAVSLEDLGLSPYVRVAELVNIFYEGLHNIFALLFGKGFGGYYVDDLGLFNGLDLSVGAFSYEAAINYGRFYNAHGAIPSLSHYNGLIGLFLMVKLALSYFKRVDKSFLVFAAYVLMLQSFYFDMFGCFSYVMALFGAEYALNEPEHKEISSLS